MTEATIRIQAMLHSHRAKENAELALMARLRRGDEAAMDDLVRLHGSTLNRLIRRLTGWSPDSDDILQEVLLAAWQKAGQFNGTGSLEGWLRRLAINRCRNHFRRESSFRRLLEGAEQWMRGKQIGTPTGERRHEQTSGLQQAMLRLKPDDRTVLVLYYLEELSSRQVADLMGVSPEAVHMRLSRARAKLRELYPKGGTHD